MRNEIGSHFEYVNQQETNEFSNSFLNFKDFNEQTYTFSGRSAIELVMKDILHEKKIQTVYMPSYCCHSMVTPLESLNLNIEYYNVFYNKEGALEYSINEEKECDVFFLMTYFGEGSEQIDETISKFKNRGSLIIEDITHRMFNDVYYSNHTDYIIGSIRKWLPVMSGGFAAKKTGRLNVIPTNSSDDYIQNIKEAMKLKKRYLDGEAIDKEDFLTLYSKGSHVFTELDFSYCMDNESLEILNQYDFNNLMNQRKANCEILYKGLSDLENINILSKALNLYQNTPIFVPIILSTRNRNSLREYLIRNNVYSPVHWPIFIEDNSDIPNFELSLICDQRYGSNEMNRIIDLIRYWYFNIME